MSTPALSLTTEDLAALGDLLTSESVAWITDGSPSPGVAVLETLYAHARWAAEADPECPVCRGIGVALLPSKRSADVEEYGCPLCRPQAWPGGFAGYARADGSWIVPPYEAGGRPVVRREEALDGPETASPF